MNFSFKQITVGIALLLITNSCLADETRDSLHQVVMTTKTDTLKVKKYYDLLKYLDLSQDSLLEYYTNELLDFGNKINSKYALGIAHQYLGEVSAQQGDFRQAIENFTKANALFGDLDRAEDQSYMYLKISDSYASLSNFVEAEQYAEKAIDLLKKSNDNGAIGRAYGNLAYQLFYAGKRTEAIEYMNRSLKYLKASSSEENYGVSLIGKAQMLGIDSIDVSKKLLEEAHVIAQKYNDKINLSQIYTAYIYLYQYTGELHKAIQAGMANIELCEKMDNQLYLIFAYFGLSEIYSAVDQYDEAMLYTKKALELSEKMEYDYGLFLAKESLASIYRETDNEPEAIELLTKLIAENKFARPVARARFILSDSYLEMDSLAAAFEVLDNIDPEVFVSDEEILYKKNVFLGAYYQKSNQPKKAVQLLQSMLPYFVEKNEVIYQNQINETLFKSYQQLGNFKMANKFMTNFYTLKDSIEQDKHIKEITTLKLTNQFNKEKELLVIEQEKEASILKAETKQSRTIAVSTGLLGLLALGFLWKVRRKNQVISAQNHQLDYLNQTKDHIFTVMGHDLRKPAISFRGITEKLRYLIEQKDYATIDKLGSVLEKNALALNQLTDNLLNWGLTQKNTIGYHPREVVILPFVDEIIDFFKTMAEDKNIELIADIPANLELHVDPNSFAIVIRNLIDNAIKFTPKNGQVKLSAKEVEQGVVIHIKDSGVGMDTHYLKDIFLLKKNKSKQGTAGEKGTGLGLHLVDELVKINRGHIQVFSQLKQGTEFQLTFPKG